MGILLLHTVNFLLKENTKVWKYAYFVTVAYILRLLSFFEIFEKITQN